MIRESARLPEWEYVFRHALTQEAVYNTLLLEQRSRFHRAVGQAQEQLYFNQLEEFAPVLAHHFDEGRQLDKAREYYVITGNEAALLHANE
jgi:predicted ATPase